MKKPKKEMRSAVDEFLSATAEIQVLMNRLEKKPWKTVSLGEITWDQVRDAKRIKEALEDVCDTVLMKP